MTAATRTMSRALSELMLRHGQTMPSPVPIALSEPTSSPMILSGLAATADVDIEHVAFAPFAFDPLPDSVPQHYDHSGEVADRIERLSHNARGELFVVAFVDHPMARRCNAFSVSGDVLAYSLHDTGGPNFYARVEKIRLREISLVLSI